LYNIVQFDKHRMDPTARRTNGWL